MKALDTPILLAILHDSPPAKDLLRTLRGEELGTTELNVFELKTLASEGPPALREGRENALARLRRRVTVLPITPESVREAARFLKRKGHPVDFQPLVWGTLAAAGCGEWITTRAYAPPKGSLPFKVRII
jgi:predicted nucleic acid-binding protein